jgi:hypothetical protein
MLTTSFSRLLKPLVIAGVTGAAASVPLLTPSTAHAYWRGGVWIGVPAPGYYAPPPVYAPPPAAYYAPYYGYHPHRFWVRAHWNGWRWVPGHWVWR